MQLEKISSGDGEGGRRRFADACGLAHALELIGERWSPLILRELQLGPRRFGDLKADLRGISANVLTQRLVELEARGLVRRVKLPPPASVHVYEATDWALEAGPILCALANWGFRSPWHDGRRRVSAVAVLLSMTTNVVADRAQGFAADIAFHLGEKRFSGRLEDSRFTVAGGEPANPVATIAGTPDDLKMVVYGGAPIALLDIAGDRDAAARFLGMFSLPERAG